MVYTKLSVAHIYNACLLDIHLGCLPGLVYLGLKHLADRYNIYYAYNPSRINRHIHSSAVTFVLWAVIMLQINITFFTGLRAGKHVSTSVLAYTLSAKSKQMYSSDLIQIDSLLS